VRWSQATDHLLGLAARVIDEKFDRGDALGRALRGRAAAAHELGQLGAQVIVDGLAEAHPDDASLAPGQPEPVVNADPDVHASADQPSCPIRAPQTQAPDARPLLFV